MARIAPHDDLGESLSLGDPCLVQRRTGTEPNPCAAVSIRLRRRVVAIAPTAEPDQIGLIEPERDPPGRSLIVRICRLDRPSAHRIVTYC